FNDVGIEVDVVQLTPLALYNFLLFDQMLGSRPAEEYDPDDPPASTVILSLGTDATDLVVTNGHRVWQRSIPLGGNHFTKALTKELKLTFAKAEHLKCNAASAPDPRALFQAMRPVFNDLLTEIQRSIGYFTSIDRHAKIERIVALGNAMKMPGLRRYLSQSLGLEVVRLESFERLAGAEVIGAPAFKENLLCFGVAYGLAVQGLNLGRGTLKTNLLPPEIVKDRFIRSKKPWALAAAAVVLLGCAIAYASNTLALNTVAESRFERAESDMKAAIGYSSQLKSDHDAAKAAFDEIAQTAQHLVGNVDNRVIWLELMRAINKSLPSDVGPSDPPQKRFSIPIEQRNEIHIESIVVQYVEDLSTWFTGVKDKYEPLSERMKAKFGGSEAAAAPVGVASEPMPSAPMPSAPMPGDLGSELGGEISGMPAAPAEGGGLGPSGPGWVVQLNGYHYHNPKSADEGVGGEQYLKEEFLTRLEDNQLHFPAIGPQKIGPDGQEQKDVLVTMDELGIGYPVLIHCSRPEPEPLVDPSATSGDIGGGAGGLGGVAASASDKNAIIVNRTNFIVQFCWRPTPPTMRFEMKKEAEQREKDGLSRIDTEPL
ncbi:MAG: pilus assembly protein PilM, partial [Pirellulaceae bacterium]|nr:pilus assembly protein PilM [Pirellulaceae bacterium]